MKTLPLDLVPYKRTPVFSEADIPSGLRARHRTKPGVWAKICVLEGRLAYFILDPDPHLRADAETIETVELTPARPGIVAPEHPHRVAPSGTVKFYVEFYRRREDSGA